MGFDISEKLQLQAVNLIILAGKSVMEVYNKPFDVEYKEDHSPLTEADKISNDIISSGLKITEYPLVLSEEMAQVAYEDRKTWKNFWLVDPLDGTKEFVKRNGEFTVNIALIEDGFPVFGLIYLPVPQTLYFAIKGHGAYRLLNAGKTTYQWMDQLMKDAEKLPLFIPKRVYTIIASRSHLSPETEAFIRNEEEKKGHVTTISAGSSIKFCLVAEGKADAYPRFAPTMEWDTAAGQVIVEEIGKRVLNIETNKPLSYNKKSLVNPHFLVTA
ncbi:MAG: 3'(2'),5'-bisphosphate nucleotidase CysQ [Bacteroidia bacterium]